MQYEAEHAALSARSPEFVPDMAISSPPITSWDGTHLAKNKRDDKLEDGKITYQKKAEELVTDISGKN
ncbi:hypothetical protein O3G_MSEX004080 [Manduca sexta]|uniref:Uncharacterized protein n=1 Tax=Manduca sexta TaxID=7130 RepID=A0A921YU99_MANSE|nr:hypothetical protein O3G_MSEX004080 [Manduca sexta]